MARNLIRKFRRVPWAAPWYTGPRLVRHKWAKLTERDSLIQATFGAPQFQGPPILDEIKP